MARSASRSSSSAAVDPESLLRIPLVRAAFSHATIRPRPRAIDRTWRYEEHVAAAQVGFVPFTQHVLYGSISRTALWTRRKARSARPLNEDDRLVAEIFFCVHDFLHAWALATVREAAPNLRVVPGLGDGEREELVFAHILTEAVATVGLDYWYLSVVDPNDVCPLGTRGFPLTVSYLESRLPEYRRARPRLRVQHPSFFRELADFYLTGVFQGVDATDLARSPALKDWLRKEVIYGAKQRGYIREWLAYVTGAKDAAGRWDRAVTVRPRWGRELVEVLGARLWRLVKDGVDEAPSGRADLPFEAAPRAAFDPRFTNPNELSSEELVTEALRQSDPVRRDILLDQLVCRHDRSRFDEDLLPALRVARTAGDARAVQGVLKRCPRLEPAKREPTFVFLLP